MVDSLLHDSSLHTCFAREMNGYCKRASNSVVENGNYENYIILAALNTFYWKVYRCHGNKMDYSIIILTINSTYLTFGDVTIYQIDTIHS